MKKKLSLIVLLIVTLLVVGCGESDTSKKADKKSSVKTSKPAGTSSGFDVDEITKVVVDSKEKAVKRGDLFMADYWNSPSISYNFDDVKEIIFPYGIEIGDSYKDVIKKLNLEAGYAAIDSEVPTEEHDGTTEIVEKKYEGLADFDTDYLDVNLVLVYMAEGDSWKLLPAVSTSSIFADDSPLLGEDLIIYSIDINGMSDEEVGIGEVISITLMRTDNEE